VLEWRGCAVSLGIALVAAACGRPGDVPAARRTGADISLTSELHVVASRVARGATLASLLHEQHLANALVADVTRAAASVFDLRRIRAGQPYEIAGGPDGALRRFEYEIDGDSLLRVARSTDSPADFVAEIVPIPKTAHEEVVRGRIDREAPSLIAAMNAAGATSELALAVADVLSGDIDFNTELQPGDEFELLVSRFVRTPTADQLADPDFEPVHAGYGPIEAVRFQNDGRQVRAVWFEPENGEAGYYDEQGGSMRRFFLKSPLKFDPVITSGFSRRRMHPVLHEPRAHLGVDYRAPIGAPVVAVADGVVTFAGTSGGSGRMIRLRHSNGFETEYLHLSVIGVRRGARVSQGDTIGKVGMTGLATGPHLDYRVKRNGTHLNPVTAHRAMPPADPVPAEDRTAFDAARDRAFARLDAEAPLRDTPLHAASVN
jgi:murein DD-endopeptidase MepM/ murein hydrolase activator NlpD